VYRKKTASQSILPQTGTTELAVAGLSLATASLAVLLLSKKHRKKVMGLLLIGSMGQSLLLPIDPATPKQWRKYLILGVEDWQKAFEKAGFKNAIQAREWPENDSTMSLEDARFSVIRYLASPIPNAYGPNVHDPRSGEIIESHIGWYHNVMALLHELVHH